MLLCARAASGIISPVFDALYRLLSKNGAGDVYFSTVSRAAVEHVAGRSNHLQAHALFEKRLLSFTDHFVFTECGYFFIRERDSRLVCVCFNFIILLRDVCVYTIFFHFVIVAVAASIHVAFSFIHAIHCEASLNFRIFRSSGRFVYGKRLNECVYSCIFLPCCCYHCGFYRILISLMIRIVIFKIKLCLRTCCMQQREGDDTWQLLKKGREKICYDKICAWMLMLQANFTGYKTWIHFVCSMCTKSPIRTTHESSCALDFLCRFAIVCVSLASL